MNFDIDLILNVTAGALLAFLIRFFVAVAIDRLFGPKAVKADRFLDKN